MDFLFESLSSLNVTFLVGTTTIILLIWYLCQSPSYWKGKGIPYVKPLPVVGSMLDYVFLPAFEVERDRYLKYGTIYGHYEGNKPSLSVADPKLLRDIFVKDFNAFANRRTFRLGIEILDKMVINLEFDEWKRVRTIVTPTLSTGKLKRMLSIFKEGVSAFVHNLRKEAEKKKSIDMKKFYGALVMDIIASSAFSTKIDSLNDPENEFVVRARSALQASTWRFLVYMMAPRLMNLFGISPFDPKTIKFFGETTVQIIKERKRLGQKRNDFLQLLMDTAEATNKQAALEDNDDGLSRNYGEEFANQKIFAKSVTKSLSMDELIAQCVIFFMAGYDTTATTLSMATYYLALNQDVQEKLRQEIKECLKESEGELTYETIQNMKYLDNVISETLRLAPPAQRLERKTEVDYKLGDTGITIPKGMMVTMPMYSIQRDPKYFPDPEKFDPDRFTPEERTKRDPYVFLPFGSGPRNCIGMRFALLEIKVTLSHIVSHFNIETCPQTLIPMKFLPNLAVITPKAIILNLEPRNDSPIKK